MPTRQSEARGARSSTIGLGGQMRAWRRNHRNAARASLARLTRAPFATIMTVMVIAVALSLPAALWLLLANLERATGGWDGANSLTAFLQSNAAPRLEAVADSVRQMSGVREVKTLSPEQSLAEFRELSGLGEALDLLDENPLPAALIVFPDTATTSPDSLRTLADDLGAVEGIESVQIDLQWVQRLFAIMQLAERLTLVFAALLGLGVLLVIGNIVRLDILSRRMEIEVEKLVGATDAFIRRPFLYGGLWLGLFSGSLALATVGIALALLAGPVRELAGTYGSAFALAGPDPLLVLALPLGGAALGMMGAWLSVGRHLRDIEPR